MTRVGVSGAAGRMGRLVAETVAYATGFELTALFDPNGAGETVAGGAAGGAAVGAGYGAGAGFMMGFGCGPLFVICSPIGVIGGVAGGAIFGAAVGGVAN